MASGDSGDIQSLAGCAYLQYIQLDKCCSCCVQQMINFEMVEFLVLIKKKKIQIAKQHCTSNSKKLLHSLNLIPTPLLAFTFQSFIFLYFPD